MPSGTLVSRATWHDDHDVGEHETIEESQSSRLAQPKSSTDGKDARLSELSAPNIARQREIGDDLETQETHAQQNETEKDSALPEVAAPSLSVQSERTVQHSNGPETGQAPATNSDEEEKQEGLVAAAHKGRSRWMETATVAWLVFFSILGTLARLGVEAIATYPYAPVSSPVLWANMGGSFFMGFLLEDHRLFRYSAKPDALTEDKSQTYKHIDTAKKLLPLYIGLTTGFCGSFTSFSTFISDSFLAMSNNLLPGDPSSPYHTINPTTAQDRADGFSFMAVVAILIVHPAVSISAVKTGAHVAVGLERFVPSLPISFVYRVLDPTAVVLGFGSWLGAVFLTIWPPSPDWRGHATMALVFAPLGALLRFYLARNYNARLPAFPLGTFIVNIFGVCINAVCYDLQHASSIIGGVAPGHAISCSVLEGVIQGFCGSATTVSTWVVELSSLRRRHAWVYGIASVGIALGLETTIVGSLAWTVGLDYSCMAA